MSVTTVPTPPNAIAHVDCGIPTVISDHKVADLYVFVDCLPAGTVIDEDFDINERGEWVTTEQTVTATAQYRVLTSFDGHLVTNDRVRALTYAAECADSIAEDVAEASEVMTSAAEALRDLLT